MQVKHIDTLNVLLIVLSFLLAVKLPFELFLFSYAFLGPLHYLTEINWLKSKSFFIKKQKWMGVLVILALLISLPTLLTFMLSFFGGEAGNSWISAWSKQLDAHFDLLILTAFLFAIGIVNFELDRTILLFFVCSFVVSVLVLKYVPVSTIAASIFLPTLVHIYVFTLLFMIFGTISNTSKAGITAIILLLVVPFVVAVLPIDYRNYLLNESTKTIFTSNIGTLNVYMARMFGADNSVSLHLDSTLGIRIQIFIAFCYTYHYLNWFSKTSIIGWSNISKTRFLVILVLWMAAVLLYWVDYKTGLAALLFLSFLHIILEFPLNIVSIKGIYGKIKERSISRGGNN